VKRRIRAQGFVLKRLLVSRSNFREKCLLNENVFSTRAIEKENESERERELFRASVRLIRAKRDASASFYFFDRRKRSDLRSLLLITSLTFGYVLDLFWKQIVSNFSLSSEKCSPPEERVLKHGIHTRQQYDDRSLSIALLIS